MPDTPAPKIIPPATIPTGPPTTIRVIPPAVVKTLVEPATITPPFLDYFCPIDINNFLIKLY